MPELLNTHDEEEPDPLIDAAFRNELGRLRKLIASGVPLDPRDQSTSALGHAAGRGHLEAAQLLLDAGANVNHSPEGLSPLANACREGQLAMAEFLFRKGAAVTDKVFSWALDRNGGKREILAFLVTHGLPANTVAHGSTSLLMAVCRHGDLETVKLLLERGADLNARGRGTALSVAEENDHRVLVDFLLERGARPEAAPQKPDVERDERRRAAQEEPGNSQRRLAWAQTLLRYGCRAAAARELQIAGAGELPTLENPAGVVWTFLKFEEEPTHVSPLLDDSRFPRALLTNGTTTLPLAVLLGPPCTRCDEHGEVTCSECDGTGTAPNLMSTGSHECPPRTDCATCMGLKYEIRSRRFGKGPCRHPTLELEFSTAKRKLSRCTQCHLPTFQYAEFACGVCGHFVCRCTTSAAR